MKMRFSKLSMIIVFVCASVVANAVPAYAAAPGNVRKVKVDEKNGKAIFLCENADVELSFLSRGVLKVDVKAPQIKEPYNPGIILKDSLKPISLKKTSRNVLSSKGLSLKYSTGPFSLVIMDENGRSLLTVPADGITINADGSYTLRFEKQEGDRFVGLGEPQPGLLGDKKLPIDRNRQVVDIWNDHPQAYIGMPFFMNPRGYGMLIENAYKAQFDLSGKETFEYRAEGGPARFYVFVEKSFYRILDVYSQLTGRAPIPPRWVTGYMQSRSHYLDQKYFRWRIENFRTKKIPADVLIYDNYWSQQNADDTLAIGNLWWKEANFPKPLEFQKETHKAGFKTIVIVQPYITDNSLTYKEVVGNKLAALDDAGKPIVACSNCYWKVPAVLLDFTNSQTRDWFGEKIKKIHDSGVDGWWTDLNEPEWDSDLMVFNGGLRRNAVHNAQGMLMHKSIWDMYKRQLPDERVFILSRSGFVGDWRYGAGIWSGDIHSSWYQFTDQIPIGLSANLSGYGLWNSDIGGFVETPTPDMFVRWIQFGVFCPIMRPHGDSYREPWMYGEEAEKYNKEMIELRYRLVPYLYSMFREMHESGKPTMRALVLDYQNDPKSYFINDEYMFGPSILVAPVTKKDLAKRKVYLPEGKWTDFWTDEIYDGSTTVTVEAPLNRIPLFIKIGAIIPMAPEMQYTDEKPVDPLTIHVYPAEKKSSYKMYEDDGKSNRYLKGEFSFTDIYADSGSFNVKRTGRYKGMQEKRAYIVVYHNENPPVDVTLDGKRVKKSQEDCETKTPPSAAWSYDAGSKKLKIYIPTRKNGFNIRIES